MIKFVNAKINIGLYVTGKREDGYHNLSTVFYPVGVNNGKPENPDPFCDILEVLFGEEPSLILQSQIDKEGNNYYPGKYADYYFTGRHVDCSPEKNLVVRGGEAFLSQINGCGLYSEDKRPRIILEKHLPDGAGLGGGSADCGFVIKTLNECFGNPHDEVAMIDMSAKIGADCAFFIKNTPAYAEGIGAELADIRLDLSGMWCLIVKPDIYVSTADAFRGTAMLKEKSDLIHDIELPIEKWRGRIYNMFEDTVFKKYPALKSVKETLYSLGAVYAAMSGSGSAIYGLFKTRPNIELSNSFLIKL